MSSEAAWLLSGPKPSMARENIFDHMMEQNRPMPRIAHFAASPEASTPVSKRQIITAPNKASIRFGLASPRKNTASSTTSKRP